MTLSESLVEMFEYDLWANSLWLEPAEYAGLALVLGHIIRAQEIWLARCLGEPSPSLHDPAHPTLALLAEVNERWRRLVVSVDLDAKITYANSTGAVFTETLVQIVHHVLNHGTYHRGDMRGRCELLGKPFPETDFIRFVWQRRGN